MTLEELRALQDREGMRDRHLLAIDENGWALAHTDNERARAGAGLEPLEECPIHRWVDHYLGTDRATGGIYQVTRKLGGAGSSAYSIERAKVSV